MPWTSRPLLRTNIGCAWSGASSKGWTLQRCTARSRRWRVGRASAGRPAHPAGAVAVCNRARDRQCSRTGAAVRGAYRLPVAVRWRRHERQDAGGLPGGAWRGAGAVADRQLHRVAEDRRGEAGSRRPGWRAGACRCRGGVVPPAQHVGGLPAGGGRASAPAARRTRAGPWRGQPATGGGRAIGRRTTVRGASSRRWRSPKRCRRSSKSRRVSVPNGRPGKPPSPSRTRQSRYRQSRRQRRSRGLQPPMPRRG